MSSISLPVASLPVGRFKQPVLSVLDLAVVGGGDTPADAFEASVELAQTAESLGYERIWYAEHHNMAAIASTATSVLIAHVAAHTESIRLGSGGVMLPNHSPLVIAEQFGTLATLHPGRIDLGLGRAPGTDQVTLKALRRTPEAAESFAADVVELQGYLRGESVIAGVRAVPTPTSDVPIYILGSSLFGAQLAAEMGLPYGFASHFAPGALTQAVAVYREGFKPSQQLSEPYVVAGVNVIAAESDEAGEVERQQVVRARVARFLAGNQTLDDAQIDRLVESRQGQQVASMMKYTAVGSPDTVRTYLDEFAKHADADELMLTPSSRNSQRRIAALQLIADS